MRVLARSQFAPLLSGPPRPTPGVRLRFDLGRPRASPPMIVPVVNPPATLHSASSFRAGALVVAIALAANAWMFMLQFQLESYETIADSGWVLPGGNEALTWIAAGGDQLAILFMLAAGYAADRAGCSHAIGQAMRLVLVAAFVCLAVLSKETAIAFLPALGIAWMVPHAGGKRVGWLKAAVAVLLGVLVALSVRRSAFGSWLPEYGD